jgi:hypothetical protein
LEEFRQTFYGALAELAQQFAVVKEEFAQDLRNRENILTMGNRKEYRFLQMMPKLDYLFVMARGAGKRPKGDSGTNGLGS